MPTFTNPPNPSPVFNDGGVPYGSFIADIKRGSSAAPTIIITAGVVENFTPTRPGVVVNRPDQVGGPNGFVVGAIAQQTGSGVLQIPTATTESPKIGDWFQYIFDGKTGALPETWVIVNISEPREALGYWKQNISCQLSKSGPPA